MLKKPCRIFHKNLRQNLSEEDIETQSLAIANMALKMNVWDKTYYHIFLSITEQKEVNTEYILQILFGKDKDVILSKSEFETCKMTLFLLTENTKIKKNPYNIPEPIDGIEVPSTKIDVVFVPVLGYDKQGNRVGYGKGFYDKFLSECKPEVIKIGLSFFNPVDCIEDANPFDIKLDYCITPDAIFQF